MRKLIVMLVLVVVGLPGRANAGILDEDRIELRPPTVTVEKLEPPVDVARAPFALPLPVARFRSTISRNPEVEDLRGPIRLSLPETGPDGLDLEVRMGAWLFKVGADVCDGRACVVINPRLDCDSRETYFWVRLQYDLGPRLSLFCESFQAAGCILGGDTTHATQHYVWDGYQVQVGAHVQLDETVSFEAGPVLYALSATGQQGGLGGRFGLRLDF